MVVAGCDDRINWNRFTLGFCSDELNNKQYLGTKTKEVLVLMLMLLMGAMMGQDIKLQGASCIFWPHHQPQNWQLHFKSGFEAFVSV